MKETLIVALGFLIVFAAIGYGGFKFAEYSCAAKFEGSTYETRFGPVSGCQVRDPKSGWVPAGNFRVI